MFCIVPIQEPGQTSAVTSLPTPLGDCRWIVSVSMSISAWASGNCSPLSAPIHWISPVEDLTAAQGLNPPCSLNNFLVNGSSESYSACRSGCPIHVADVRIISASSSFLMKNPHFTHPMREDVKKKYFSTPLREIPEW